MHTWEITQQKISTRTKPLQQAVDDTCHVYTVSSAHADIKKAGEEPERVSIQHLPIFVETVHCAENKLVQRNGSILTADRHVVGARSDIVRVQQEPQKDAGRNSKVSTNITRSPIQIAVARTRSPIQIAVAAECSSWVWMKKDRCLNAIHSPNFKWYVPDGTRPHPPILIANGMEPDTLSSVQ